MYAVERIVCVLAFACMCTKVSNLPIRKQGPKLALGIQLIFMGSTFIPPHRLGHIRAAYDAFSTLVAQPQVKPATSLFTPSKCHMDRRCALR
jgi:hypothetical protein